MIIVHFLDDLGTLGVACNAKSNLCCTIGLWRLTLVPLHAFVYNTQWPCQLAKSRIKFCKINMFLNEYCYRLTLNFQRNNHFVRQCATNCLNCPLWCNVSIWEQIVVEGIRQELSAHSWSAVSWFLTTFGASVPWQSSIPEDESFGMLLQKLVPLFYDPPAGPDYSTIRWRHNYRQKHDDHDHDRPVRELKIELKISSTNSLWN